MSYFDMIDRRQPSKPEPKLEEKVTPMPRFTLDQLADLPAEAGKFTAAQLSGIAQGLRNQADEVINCAPRKKPGRPPKAKR